MATSTVQGSPLICGSPSFFASSAPVSPAVAATRVAMSWLVHVNATPPPSVIPSIRAKFGGWSKVVLPSVPLPGFPVSQSAPPARMRRVFGRVVVIRLRMMTGSVARATEARDLRVDRIVRIVARDSDQHDDRARAGDAVSVGLDVREAFVGRGMDDLVARYVRLTVASVVEALVELRVAGRQRPDVVGAVVDVRDEQDEIAVVDV